MRCPICDHEEAEAFEECPACGVIVERAHGPLDRRPVSPAPSPRSAVLAGSSVAVGGGWPVGSVKAVVVGAALAFVVYAVPTARFVFSYLAIVVHELGHTVVAWVMGYPAIPALDLLEGGGVSIRYARSPLLCLLVVGSGLSVVFLVRRTRWLLPATALFAIHLLLLLSPLHDAAIVAAGHGAELVFAALSLARGLIGDGTLGERVAWVSAGVFVLLLNAGFGLRLLFDPAELERYAAARRGETGTDLARLAEALGAGIDVLAALIFLATLLVPPAVMLASRRWVRADLKSRSG